MGFPIVDDKGVSSNPPEGQIQFVTFTGNTVVTAVISTTDGEVEVRFVEADASGKLPKTPEEFLALKPRVILKFPHFASFQRHTQTLLNSLGVVRKGLDEAAAKKSAGGKAKRRLAGGGRLKEMPGRHTKPVKTPEPS